MFRFFQEALSLRRKYPYERRLSLARNAQVSTNWYFDISVNTSRVLRLSLEITPVRFRQRRAGLNRLDRRRAIPMGLGSAN